MTLSHLRRKLLGSLFARYFSILFFLGAPLRIIFFCIARTLLKVT